MKRLKDDVMKLSKAEQYEIYMAIAANLFGDNDHKSLSNEQMTFINTRSRVANSHKENYVSPEQLRRQLDDMIG